MLVPDAFVVRADEAEVFGDALGLALVGAQQLGPFESDGRLGLLGLVGGLGESLAIVSHLVDPSLRRGPSTLCQRVPLGDAERDRPRAGAEPAKRASRRQRFCSARNSARQGEGENR